MMRLRMYIAIMILIRIFTPSITNAQSGYHNVGSNRGVLVEEVPPQQTVIVTAKYSQEYLDDKAKNGILIPITQSKIEIKAESFKDYEEHVYYLIDINSVYAIWKFNEYFPVTEIKLSDVSQYDSTEDINTSIDNSYTKYMGINKILVGISKAFFAVILFGLVYVIAKELKMLKNNRGKEMDTSELVAPVMLVNIWLAFTVYHKFIGKGAIFVLVAFIGIIVVDAFIYCKVKLVTKGGN